MLTMTACTGAGEGARTDARTGNGGAGAETSARWAPEQAPTTAAPPSENRTLHFPRRPESLLGLTGTEITRRFGPPHFRRLDDPAALWQYRGKECILDIFFYARGPDYQVTHAEFRAPLPRTGGGQRGTDGTNQACGKQAG